MTVPGKKEGDANAGELLKEKQVLACIPVSLSTLRRWVLVSSFPPPIRLPGGMLRWRGEDVQAWLDAQSSSAPTATRYLLSSRQIRQRLGISKATLSRWVRSGDFPAGIRLSPKLTLWAGDQWEDWLANLETKEDRNAVAPKPAL